jgi:Ca-activated chloride channel family protein
MNRHLCTIAATALILLAVAACGMRGTTMYRTESGPASASRQAPAPTAKPAHDRDAEIEGRIQPRMSVADLVLEEPADTRGLKKLSADDRPVDDRDLGAGAGGEKLGDPRRQDGEDGGGERYAQLADNPFVSTASAGGDASTFGLDVDSAGYANVRRFLLQEQRLPPPAAVRIEELVNTIAYAYPTPDPAAGRPLAVHTTVAPCPWRPAHRLVRVALRATVPAERPPLNLVFLIDTSGSMSDANKLPLVQQSLLLLAEQLTARDRLAIVTYAGNAQTVLPATAGDAQRRIREAIRGLTHGGGTNGAGGIQAAYAEAGRGRQPGAVNRVMLCTDGDINLGMTGHDDLRRLVEAGRADGIQLNCYGFGMGNIKDDTMELLANRGDGIYAYIDGRDEARRLFDAGALGQLVTVARDAKIQVFWNPAACSAWRLLGYENRVLRREDFNDDRVDAGDVGAGHTVTALYEVVPADGSAPPAGDGNPFLRGGAADPTTLLRVRLRWKDAGAGISRLHEQDAAAAPQAMDRDFSAAAAAAGMGLLLRRSPHAGACTWGLVADLATAGNDGSAQRTELARLIATASRLGGGR